MSPLRSDGQSTFVSIELAVRVWCDRPGNIFDFRVHMTKCEYPFMHDPKAFENVAIGDVEVWSHHHRVLTEPTSGKSM